MSPTADSAPGEVPVTATATPTTSTPEPPKAVPIFVLGFQRSGTTWLANLVAEHPRVAAVQAEDHFGIHESIFFSHFARAYGDLEDDDDFARFARDFTGSDYYLLTGIEPEWLTRRRPRGYAETFRALMEELARRRGHLPFWVEKSPHHTLLAEEIADAFPDARFLCIVRRTADVVNSWLWAHGEPPPWPRRLGTLARTTWSCVAHQRWLQRFARRSSRAVALRYEDLKADPEAEMRRVTGLVGLPFDPSMLAMTWRKNSSFRAAGSRRRRPLSRADRAVVAAVSSLLVAVPVTVLHRLTLARRRRRGVEWPAWCWKRRDHGAA